MVERSAPNTIMKALTVIHQAGPVGVTLRQLANAIGADRKGLSAQLQYQIKKGRVASAPAEGRKRIAVYRWVPNDDFRVENGYLVKSPRAKSRPAMPRGSLSGSMVQKRIWNFIRDAGDSGTTRQDIQSFLGFDEAEVTAAVIALGRDGLIGIDHERGIAGTAVYRARMAPLSFAARVFAVLTGSGPEGLSGREIRNRLRLPANDVFPRLTKLKQAGKLEVVSPEGEEPKRYVWKGSAPINQASQMKALRKRYIRNVEVRKKVREADRERLKSERESSDMFAK